MSQYTRYLNVTQYKNMLNPMWYSEFVEKIRMLEELHFKLNIRELNGYMYQRYLYENNKNNTFDDTKYDLENYYSNGYETDIEIKHVDITFERTMDMLSEKLKKTRFYFD
jgi:hypothetical protein